jgi:hypothetical protein
MKDFLTPTERKKLNDIVFKKTAPKLIERAKSLKYKMINEFRDHPISREIQAGETSLNLSETLSGRQGNLFSFIGFEAGSEPLEPIYEILSEISIIQLHST